MHKKNEHRHERAKKLISGRGGHKVETMQKTGSHKNALSGAMPKSFPVAGASPRKRSDRKPRKFASGGGVDGDEAPKKKSPSKTEVNINVIGGGDKPAPMPIPIPAPGAGAPPMMPPRPPMGMPPQGAPGVPPGAGMRPPGAMKRGGGVKENPKYPIDGGAGGGEGRLEKAAAQSRKRPSREDDD